MQAYSCLLRYSSTVVQGLVPLTSLCRQQTSTVTPANALRATVAMINIICVQCLTRLRPCRTFTNLSARETIRGLSSGMSLPLPISGSMTAARVVQYYSALSGLSDTVTATATQWIKDCSCCWGGAVLLGIKWPCPCANL